MSEQLDIFPEPIGPQLPQGMPPLVGVYASTGNPFAGRPRRGKANGYAARPGSGPAGETCKTCAHYCRVEGGSKIFPKCGVLRHRWTHGAATDIRAKSPACEFFARPVTS